MKPLSWLLISIFLILPSFIIGVSIGYLSQDNSQVFIKNETIDKIVFNNTMTKIDKINQIAWAVANERNYTRGRYDCTQFSKRLSIELKSIGLKAYCVPGIAILNNKRGGHTWVEVNDMELGILHIEATGGYIISDEDYLENYKPIKVSKGVCW
jgi:hypothetical protein